MMLLRLPTTLTLILSAALLGACGTKVPLNEVPVETRTPQTGATAPAGGNPATASAAGQAPATSAVASVNAANSSLDAANRAGRVVYFDFDSDVIRDEFKPLVDAHARALASNNGRRIVVEGHTDERGGREYNLALGQRRADAVARALKLLGGRDNQIETSSFGKERPVDAGHDEAAWAKNRRAELKDR